MQNVIRQMSSGRFLILAGDMHHGKRYGVFSEVGAGNEVLRKWRTENIRYAPGDAGSITNRVWLLSIKI